MFRSLSLKILVLRSLNSHFDFATDERPLPLGGLDVLILEWAIPGFYRGPTNQALPWVD